MSNRLIFVCSHGKDDPERAIVVFTAANVAAIGGQETAVLCTIDGVWLGTQGRDRRRGGRGLHPAVRAGRRLRRERRRGVALRDLHPASSITDDLLIEGARIVGAARVIEEVVAGAKTISYA